MKTKILAASVLTAVLSTGLYAAYGEMGPNQGMKNFNGNQSYKMMNKKMRKGGFPLMGLLYKLNLTSEQKDAIMKIKQEQMKNRMTANTAFTKDGFDKAKFIELMKQKRDNMIESQAEMIDKVYKVLTPKQKEQLKVLMDLKKEKMNQYPMMGKRMNFDKNCNGRG